MTPVPFLAGCPANIPLLRGQPVGDNWCPRYRLLGQARIRLYSHRTGLCISPIGQSVRWEQGFPLFPGLRAVFPEGWCQRHLKAQVLGAATWGRITVNVSSRHTEKLGKRLENFLVCGDKSF